MWCLRILIYFVCTGLNYPINGKVHTGFKFTCTSDNEFVFLILENNDLRYEDMWDEEWDGQELSLTIHVNVIGKIG